MYRATANGSRYLYISGDFDEIIDKITHFISNNVSHSSIFYLGYKF